MDSFLMLGFLVGMGHALEADHLAAVGALSGNRQGRARLAWRGAVWGLGHTVTLFSVCTAVIVFALVLSPARAAALEFAVGVLLVLLASDVLRRLWAKKVHFHAHRHQGEKPHIHAHSHAAATATATASHVSDPHEHRHPKRFPLRAFLVGLAHGAAGSAALIVLALAATRDATLALTYVALFGLGSIAGTAALSFMASWPLGALEKSAGWLHSGSQLAIAGLAAAIGISVMADSWALAAGAF